MHTFSASSSGNRKSCHSISSMRHSRNDPSKERVVEPFSIQSMQVNTRVREPIKIKKSKSIVLDTFKGCRSATNNFLLQKKNSFNRERHHFEYIMIVVICQSKWNIFVVERKYLGRWI